MINSTSKPIVLVCAADDNYAMPMVVAVHSALVNLKRDRKVALYIIDGGISQFSKGRIIKSLNSEQVEISWVRPNEDLLANMKVERHLTIVAYYRILIPQIVPKHFDKAIYLDSDMVVRGNLEELWNIDLGENYVLAVQDDNQQYISMSGGLRNYKELGIDPNLKYFNSGLLVINLKKWRTENVAHKVFSYLEQNKDYVRDHDQDGLNGVLAGKWGELDPRWNQMPRIYKYLSWQDSPYEEEAYNELLHNPHIIHYTCPPKPWHRGCYHPNKALFFEYLDKTAWSGWRNTVWRRAWRRVSQEIKHLWKFRQDTRQAIQTKRVQTTSLAEDR